MECLPGFLFSRELLLALVLHGDHHHVGLVDQVRGRSEHCCGLAFLKEKVNVRDVDGSRDYLEILLQGVRELFAVFHKFSFPLFESVFPLCPGDVRGHLIDSVQ